MQPYCEACLALRCIAIDQLWEHGRARISTMVVLGTLLLGLVLLGIRPVSVHAATSFTFTAAGDYGSLLTGTHGAQVLAKIRTLSSDTHLLLGNLRYYKMSE